MRALSCVTAVVLAASMVFTAPSSRAEASVEEFYRDNVINIIVGFGPGGGYDTYARLLSQHMSRHIPGEPTIVVQNLTGAGSARAANYVYEQAPRDGTYIAAVNQNMPMFQLLGGEGARFDSGQLQWLGSMGHSNGTIYSWHDSGVTNLDEAKERPLVLGATGTSTDSHIFPTIMNVLLGTQFEIIHGYPDGNSIHLALERGEVSGRGGNSWASLMSTQRDVVEEGRIHLLAQIGFEPEPDIPDVPLLLDLVEDETERQVVTVISLPTAIGFAHWVAPEVPQDRVEALRAAYDATMSDPDFLADAERANMIIRPQTGQQIQDLVARAVATPPEVLENTATLLGWR